MLATRNGHIAPLGDHPGRPVQGVGHHHHRLAIRLLDAVRLQHRLRAPLAQNLALMQQNKMVGITRGQIQIVQHHHQRLAL